MAGIGDFEVDERGSTPSVMHNAAAENTPVLYPRPESVRDMSGNYKGAASTVDATDVNYKVGPYPVEQDITGPGEGR